ncbi:hypothetical protein D3C74_50250 [compost metagenome]
MEKANLKRARNMIDTLNGLDVIKCEKELYRLTRAEIEALNLAKIVIKSARERYFLGDTESKQTEFHTTGTYAH